MMTNENTTESAQARIADDFLAIGLRRGGGALVHSSLSSLGCVPGGAETVIRGLLQALGPDGTQRTQLCRSHDFTGYTQRYERVADLLDIDEHHSGVVMSALIHVLEARPMWEAALSAYRKDALAFVEARGQGTADRRSEMCGVHR